VKATFPFAVHKGKSTLIVDDNDGSIGFLYEAVAKKDIFALPESSKERIYLIKHDSSTSLSLQLNQTVDK
jgi:hypothetical protein